MPHYKFGETAVVGDTVKFEGFIGKLERIDACTGVVVLEKGKIVAPLSNFEKVA